MKRTKKPSRQPPESPMNRFTIAAATFSAFVSPALLASALAPHSIAIPIVAGIIGAIVGWIILTR